MDQWFFELFYKRGLAVKKKSAVNWCGECNTVLANEQVIDGAAGAVTMSRQKDLEQWFFKITDYAEELLDDLKLLNGWPERVKTMQKNWIGRSEGLEFSFDAACIDAKLPVYTTRPDTSFGVTFVVLAAEHPMVEQLCRDNPKADEIRLSAPVCATSPILNVLPASRKKKVSLPGNMLSILSMAAR